MFLAFFNFAGISVTKEMSATTRMVLDSVRTLVIWGVSLGVGWQKFQYLQLIGFLILVSGMCVYNDLLIGMYDENGKKGEMFGFDFQTFYELY